MQTPIDGHTLSTLCDYSFGDQAGVVSNVYGSFMKEANKHNKEFMKLCETKETLSLFIDNIRLYRRYVETGNNYDRMWVRALHHKNDLLELCASVPNKFVIFSGLEDTPIDDKIKIPYNVLRIYATNALYNNEKIIPMPYGLQRRMYENDKRVDIFKNYKNDSPATKLLYMNMGIGRNDIERRSLLRFKNCGYATAHLNDQSMYFPYDRYSEYLDEIKKHKFMLCPMGHGVDCHRNWECLYMRRVPIMRRTPYLEKLFSGFPILFVESYDEVDEKLLEDSEYLCESAKTIDLTGLELNNYYKKCLSTVS